MLLITGLRGLSSLCVLIKALSFGAMGFICSKYFCCFLSIIALHLCIVCWICFWNDSVGSLLISIIWFSCMKVSIFCFNVSLSIMTMVLPLSAFATVRLFCSKRVFICFRFYWHLLRSMLHVFVSAIFLIFLIVWYLNVFYIVMSKCLLAYSVAIINCFGFFSIAYSNPKFNVFISLLLNFICVKFTNLVWNVCFVAFLLLSLWGSCFCSASSFFIEILVYGVHHFV